MKKFLPPAGAGGSACLERKSAAICKPVFSPIWRWNYPEAEVNNMGDNPWKVILIVLAVVGGIALISAIGTSLMRGGMMGG